MKSFKKFSDEEDVKKDFLESLEQKPTILIFKKTDERSKFFAEQILEEGRTYNLNKGYSIRFDKAHVLGQQDHTHFMIKNNEIGVINRDGTPSHGSDVKKIPYGMIKAAKDRGYIGESLLQKSAGKLVENYLFPETSELINEIDMFIESMT
ncbi:MAG: hypothetical protein KDI13_09385 [Alphaproteobacteria bacterium]|nr:hypothetical protein [Alphaproteobacteria bacterium]